MTFLILRGRGLYVIWSKICMSSENSSTFRYGSWQEFGKIKIGQILHSVANSSPPLQHLRKWLCCLGAMTRRWIPQTRYTNRRNPASIMRGLISSFFGKSSATSNIYSFATYTEFSNREHTNTIREFIFTVWIEVDRFIFEFLISCLN